MQDTIKTALLRYNNPLPRYTSYPPANFFNVDVPRDLIDGWMRALAPDQPLSLYIHIPFCPKMCWFCGCHTRATAHYGAVRDYLDLLDLEIDQVTKVWPTAMRVDHIHFGGGSPTILSSADFDHLMAHLRRAFSLTDRCAMAIEIDPRQVTPEKIATYAAQGFARVSIGVQDTNPKVMQAINRPQPFELVARAASLCKQAGITGLNIDLVYGLPYQTVAGIRETVAQVLSLAPDRLALFGYAHVPWLKKHMRLMPGDQLPDAELRYDLFTAAADLIEASGYTAIGIDHFAKAGDALALSARAGTLRRNFQGYIPAEESMPMIGLGASAISSYDQGYVQNQPGVPPYRDALHAGILPHYKYHAYSGEDFFRMDLIERLMCDSQVDLAAIAARHGRSTSDLAVFHESLAPFLNAGLATIDRDHKILRVSSRLAVRMIAAVFDQYKVPTTAGPRHAAAI